MEYYITINRICNSMGWGYAIEYCYETESCFMPHIIAECAYYGYSKREALAKFRRENGLRYKHITTYDWTN